MLQNRSPMLALTLCLAGGQSTYLSAAAALAPTTATSATTEFVRAPVPSSQQQVDAEKLVVEVYGNPADFRSIPEHHAAADKLMGAAHRSGGDPVSVFVLLRDAGSQACLAGDVEKAIDADHEIDRQFSVDPDEQLQASVKALIPHVARPGDVAALTAVSLDLADHFIASGKDEAAQTLASQAISIAAKSDDATLKTNTAAQVDLIRETATAHKAIASSVRTLSQRPDEAAANLAVGKFDFIYREDTARALPMIAKGQAPSASIDCDWVSAAIADLHQPADADQQAAVGDDWWALSAKETTHAKTVCDARADYWYKIAEPKLAGLKKAVVEKRLSQERSSTPSLIVRRTIDLLKLVEPAKDAIAGTWTMVNGALHCDNEKDPQLRFPYHPPEEYDLNFEFETVPDEWGTNVILSKDGKTFSWGMAGTRSRDSSFTGFPDNPLPTHYEVPRGKRVHCRIEVRRHEVRAFMDDVLIQTVDSDFRNISYQWAVGDPAELGFVCWWSDCTFYAATVTEISGAGAVLRG